MSRHRVSPSPFLSSLSHTTQVLYTNSYTYSHPNLNFLQYTIQILLAHAMWSAQAVRDLKIDHTFRHLSALRGTPKRVIVQWVGIGTRTYEKICKITLIRTSISPGHGHKTGDNPGIPGHAGTLSMPHKQLTNWLRNPEVHCHVLYTPAIGPYLEQDLSSLQRHNPPPLSPFQYYPSICVSTSLNVSSLHVFPLIFCLHFWIVPYVLQVLPILVVST